MLRLTQPLSESNPYRLKVNGWIEGPNHHNGMSSGGNNGVVVEALEVLPRRLTPVTEPTNYMKLSKKITRQSRRFSKL